MALFFDAEWFDRALARNGLARGDAARALGLSEDEIGELWKDQREVSARDVAVLAQLLAVPAETVAERAGISTPTPQTVPDDVAAQVAAIAEFAERLGRVERTLAEIKALLLDLRRKG